MIKKYDGKIGFWEFSAIIIYCIGSRLTDTTPVLLTRAGLNAAWILPIISGLIMLVPLMCLLSLLKLYRNKSLLDIIYHLVGKYIGFLLAFLLLVIILEYLIITTRSYADILSTMFYLKTPVIFLLILIIASSSYIASKGINIIGGICWVIYPLFQIVALMLLPLIWREVNLNYVFPLGGPGILTLLKEGTVYTTVIGEVIILAIFFPVVRSFKEYKNATLLGLGVSVFLMSLFMIIYICTYGYPILNTLNYPFHQLTRIASIERFATNLEALFLGFWAISSVVRFSIFFCAAVSTVSAITKVRNSKLLLAFIAAITFFMAKLPENFTKYILRYRELGVTVFWIYLLSLPILLWLVAKWKGEYDN